MTVENKVPQTIWVITEETVESEETPVRGGRSSYDIGGKLGEVVNQAAGGLANRHKEIEVAVLKQRMQGFLQAIREILDGADQLNSQIALDEVEISVEINKEGQISLLGTTTGKVGDKGAITFKFKRK